MHCIGNVSNYGGGALFFYQLNLYLTLRGNQFNRNRADYHSVRYISYTVGLGGAVLIVYYNNYTTVENCHFHDNFGLFGGG